MSEDIYKNAYVVDIKRNSLDDGPGIRSVVFFKGCPLTCVWCQNPETCSRAQEIVYEAENCIGCQECMKSCKYGAINIRPDGAYPIDAKKCIQCGDCTDACITKTLRFVGKHYTVNELVKYLLRDRVFYKNSGGGVTLSGGEPSLNMEYVSELAARLKEEGIHICIETCGAYPREKFEKLLLPYLDLVFFDIKIFDEEDHRKYCGASNKNILENFRALKAAGVNVLPRIPLIPDVTATEKNLREIRAFLEECGVNELGLLPYNPLWQSKLKTIGQTARYTRAEWMSKEEKDAVKRIFEGFKYRDF